MIGPYSLQNSPIGLAIPRTSIEASTGIDAASSNAIGQTQSRKRSRSTCEQRFGSKSAGSVGMGRLGRLSSRNRPNARWSHSMAPRTEAAAGTAQSSITPKIISTIITIT